MATTHPWPGQVLSWFQGDVDSRVLTERLKGLRDDANWRVQSIPGPSVWDITLVYWPTGIRYSLQLERVRPGPGSPWRITT